MVANSEQIEQPHQLMFEAVANACLIGWAVATKALKGRVARTSKVLREAGVSPEEVDAFARWWRVRDWRGKMGQPPLPHQVQESWGRFKRDHKRGSNVVRA